MSRRDPELRILIADGQELVRRGIRAVLEERDWIVCGEAATAGDALEKATKLRPDLLLLDVKLPDMDAAEVIPEIMKVSPPVKIIALAMHDSAEQAGAAPAAHATGLVVTYA